MSNPPARTKRGTFAPGNRISKGRPAGARNKATLAREAMETKGTLMVARRMPKILQKALEMAEEGDKEMLKMILKDTVFKSGVLTQDTEPAKVEVNITNMTAPVQGQPAIIINGQAQE